MYTLLHSDGNDRSIINLSRFWNKSNVGVIYTFLLFIANLSKDAFQSTTMFEDPFKSSTSSKGLYKPSQK